MCVVPDCGRAGQVVDHILPRTQGGSDDHSDLRSMCRSHHNSRTMREATMRFGKPVPMQRPGAGEKGYRVQKLSLGQWHPSTRRLQELKGGHSPAFSDSLRRSSGRTGSAAPRCGPVRVLPDRDAVPLVTHRVPFAD
ncbi:MAG: HNH endonuclease signature motif containing protein [Chloroflexota bacterium]